MNDCKLVFKCSFWSASPIVRLRYSACFLPIILKLSFAECVSRQTSVILVEKVIKMTTSIIPTLSMYDAT